MFNLMYIALTMLVATAFAESALDTSGSNESEQRIFLPTEVEFEGEWGSLLPRAKVLRTSLTNDLQGWSPGGRSLGGRLDAIENAIQSNTESMNLEALVRDYFSEDRYANAELVVVRRPENNAGGPNNTALQAYENMKIRLKNTKYNDVRPGPGVYYIPGGAIVLSETVKQLNKASTPFLIRGGGHSYEANTLPTTDEWAVIDMAKFTSLRLSGKVSLGNDGVKYREFTFGTGLRLGTLYVYLARKGLALVSGTCPANGAGGYFLGGGAGPAMRKFGWGTDQMIRAKVILGDGSFAVADSDDSKALPGQSIKPSALLYALRGGGAGTAIVYEYTLKVYDAPRTVSRCRMAFSTTTKDAYQTFVRAWSDEWKISDLDGATYPFIRLYSRNPESYIVMDGWDVPTEEVSNTMLEGMATAENIQNGEPDCKSFDWDEFLSDTFGSYYSSYPEMQDNLRWYNYSNPWLLAMDYTGYDYAGADIPVAPPLSPYADFVAMSPKVNGPNAFTAQGILSSRPWNAETAAQLWDGALSMGFKFYSYALGGRLDDERRGAAPDDSVEVGAAFDALSHGVLLTVTDAPAADEAANNASLAVSRVLDTLTVSKQPSRYYNFLNCYNISEPELFRLYYGDDVSVKLVDIKSRADPESRLKTWCDI